MIRRPPRSTRTDTLFPDTTLFRSEQAMRRLIEAEQPAHGVQGEEFGISNPGAEWRWILDPIDGTKSFISGSPLFGTLRSEERRVGKECVSTCRSRWSPYH